jgi:hypothetical protein
MMTHLQHTGRRAFAAMAVLVIAAVVTACHHGDDHDSGQGQPPVAGTPNPPAATDAFVANVTQVAATQDDTSEPASIDAVATTAPEGTEPLPVPGA